MTMPVLLSPLRAAPQPVTERDIIHARVRSRKEWARRRRLLRLRAFIFGRTKEKGPPNWLPFSVVWVRKTEKPG